MYDDQCGPRNTIHSQFLGQEIPIFLNLLPESMPKKNKTWKSKKKLEIIFFIYVCNISRLKNALLGLGVEGDKDGHIGRSRITRVARDRRLRCREGGREDVVQSDGLLVPAARCARRCSAVLCCKGTNFPSLSITVLVSAARAGRRRTWHGPQHCDAAPAAVSLSLS